MKKLALLSLAVLFVIAGCRDLQKQQVQVPIEIAGPSFSASGEEDAPTGRSTVCVAYDEQLAEAQGAGDAEAIATLETIIADACN